MRSHSSSAKAANTWKMSLPMVVVGIDRFLQAAEPTATVGQAGDGVDQVPQ
jgi:hypothetical protein